MLSQNFIRAQNTGEVAGHKGGGIPVVGMPQSPSVNNLPKSPTAVTEMPQLHIHSMRICRLLCRVLSLALSLLVAQAASYPTGAGLIKQTFDFPEATTDLNDGTALGADHPPEITTPVTGIFGGRLQLIDKAATHVIGSFKLPDLDPGNVVRSFDLTFSVGMEPLSTGEPGEGWSVNFGGLPADNGTGEGGFVPLRRGLTIAFDTRDDGGDPTSIQVVIDGVVVGNFPRTFVLNASPRVVVVHWDSFGLDLTYDNRAVFADLPTPGFAPNPGDSFGFTARSTGVGMSVLLDDLRAATQTLPVLETGGAIISEFVANNDIFEDEYADKPGWIELLNGSSDVIDLAGWYLTDSKSNLTKWKIAALKLNPYNYQLAFASGRNIQFSPSNFPHTSFTLAKNSGYLALVKPDGKSIASSYTYGVQDKNVSYGEMGASRVRGYMFPASPGLVNVQEPSPQSRSSEIAFSHAGGFVPQPIELVLSAAAIPGIEIRYTIDRTEPGPTSPIYSKAIPVASFTTIKARSYAPGHLPGAVSSRTFVFMDSSMTNYAGTSKVFDSNLPFLFVDSFGFSVDGSTGGSRPYRPGYLVVVRPDPATGRANLNTAPEYAGPCGVHLRGESSAVFDQRSYSLELWDDTGRDFDASLLGMPEESDWVLYGPWSEKTLMRNKLVFDWMRTLRGQDGLAVRSEFVELFFNQTKPVSGRVGYSSYRGIYLLMEKLKRGKGRLSIENLNEKTTAPNLITGGYIIRKDKNDAQKNNWVSGSLGISLQSYDPDRMNTVQFNYMKKFTADLEKALTGASFRNVRTGYRAYMDADTFIDFQWFTEVAKQVDGYIYSTYFHKNRDGRMRAGPLWDFNISLGNADYGSGETPTGWLYDGANGTGQLWYPRLHADPDYKLATWDRYWQMRRTFLATDAVMATINRHMATLLDGYTGLVSNRPPATIQNPVARHLRKWPRLGIRDWPNPAAETKIKTWQAEVDYMKTWISNRLAWLDNQSLRVSKTVLRPPEFSSTGGAFIEPVTLRMSPFTSGLSNVVYPGGTLYYTLDDSDPRLPGGVVSSSARKYGPPVRIDAPVTVQARLLAQNQWSPLASVTFWYDAVPASASNLVISEVLYQPAPLTPDETAARLSNDEQFEFIELRNRTHRAIDLSGVSFLAGIEFDFSHLPEAAQLLKAGQSVVLVADLRAFQLRYPRVPIEKIIGEYRGRLNNGGETLMLQAADGRVIADFTYDNKSPWPNVGTGAGHSLVLVDPVNGGRAEDASSWAASARAGGTPGMSGLGLDRFVGDSNRDSDGDGLNDFLEFVAGSDPEDPQSAHAPRAALSSIRVNGVEDFYLTYAVRRNPSLPGIYLAIESAGELGVWHSAESVLALHESTTNADGTVTDLYRTVTPWRRDSGQTWFLRLRASQR